MKIELAPYNPKWSGMYNNIRQTFYDTFGEKIAGIEHIGSTSVHGLGAKPIIDVLLGVDKLKDADAIIPDMELLGYEYVSKYEDIMPERRYFVMRQKHKAHSHC